MKYIRTENGIYEVSELNEYATHYKMNKTVVIDKLQTKYILNKSILAQANTIEELCDYFLIDKNDIEHYEPTTLIIFDDYDDFRYSMMCKDNANGYGCIKTNKGLIYVAKINDKGELMLI